MSAEAVQQTGLSIPLLHLHQNNTSVIPVLFDWSYQRNKIVLERNDFQFSVADIRHYLLTNNGFFHYLRDSSLFEVFIFSDREYS